jgi:hypothetical protein
MIFLSRFPTKREINRYSRQREMSSNERLESRSLALSYWRKVDGRYRYRQPSGRLSLRPRPRDHGITRVSLVRYHRGSHRGRSKYFLISEAAPRGEASPLPRGRAPRALARIDHDLLSEQVPQVPCRETIINGSRYIPTCITFNKLMGTSRRKLVPSMHTYTRNRARYLSVCDRWKMSHLHHSTMIRLELLIRQNYYIFVYYTSLRIIS